MATTVVCGVAFASSGRAQEKEELDAPSIQEWLHWGPVAIRPRASVALTYDDNITLARTNELSDTFLGVAPGVSLLAGDKQNGETPWSSLEYDATVMIFNQYTEYNGIDHVLAIEGLWPMAKLTLGATAGYEKLSTPLIYTSDRVDRNLYRLALTSRYQYSEKTSFEVNGRYEEFDYGDNFNGSKEWANDNWVNHQWSGKLNLGVGTTFGYLDPGIGSGQTFQRASLRAGYNLTYKLQLDTSVGMEFRQYEEFSSTATPVFSLGATYRPVNRTTIGLNGYRREQSSVSVVEANQIATGISLNVRQQVWDRIGVNVGGSFENSEYRTVSGTGNEDRSDQYFTVNVGIDMTLTLHWNVALAAQHRENRSDSPGGIFFDDNQVSLQTNYTF